MEECVKLGLTRSIGLSNFNSEQRVIDCPNKTGNESGRVPSEFKSEKIEKLLCES